MASAAQQRLRRTRIPEQMVLDLGIPAALSLDDPSSLEREQADFARIAGDVARAQPHTRDPWLDSPYAWIKRLPPAGRGTAGQALLARWLTHCGVPAAPRHGEGDHDFVVDDAVGPPLRIQLRVSTQWKEGDFIFQGIKPGEYDRLALLGIAPHHVYLWAVPQREALAHLETSGWICVPAGRAPAWLGAHGGWLTDGTRQMLR